MFCAMAKTNPVLVVVVVGGGGSVHLESEEGRGQEGGRSELRFAPSRFWL